MSGVFGAERSRCRRRAGRVFPLLLLALGVLALPAAVQAQPFGAWLTLAGFPSHGYVAIPHSPALNPTSAITIEAWVDVSDAHSGACSSIIGKNYHQAYWVGVCGTTLRAYFRGDGSFRDAGVIPAGRWTHIALVYDGSTQKHYINGELVRSFVVSGPPTTSTAEVRIGSDVSYPFTPAGAIDEVRIWNVARSQAQIRGTINVPLSAPQTGLVAVWGLNANALDPVGGHNGTVTGAGINYFTFPVAITCGSSSATSLCLQGRFSISATFRTGAPGTAEGTANVVPVANPGSGLFWFFSSDNWEVMVKAINGCALNSRYWIFSAATTNVFYRLEVFDIRAGVNKVYFNYPGPPAPAVTDTDAFATCP
jgi:concanavalin A-like lectin/glucanase superfamily protein